MSNDIYEEGYEQGQKYAIRRPDANPDLLEDHAALLASFRYNTPMLGEEGQDVTDLFVVGFLRGYNETISCK